MSLLGRLRKPAAPDEETAHTAYYWMMEPPAHEAARTVGVIVESNHCIVVEVSRGRQQPGVQWRLKVDLTDLTVPSRTDGVFRDEEAALTAASRYTEHLASSDYRVVGDVGTFVVHYAAGDDGDWYPPLRDVWHKIRV